MENKINIEKLKRRITKYVHLEKLNDNEIFEFEMEDFYNEIEKMTVIDTIKIVRAEKFDPWEYITKL